MTILPEDNAPGPASRNIEGVLRRVFASLVVATALGGSAVSCGDAKVYPYVHQSGGKVTCPDMMVGWAAVPGPDVDGGAPQVTTGGGDLPPITVNNVHDLTTALLSPEPLVIMLDGMLPLTDSIKVTADKDNRNGNKTLIGVGANSGLTGAGLDLSYADNIKVRNLKISKASAGEGDAITILASHHIWIDHCDLSSDRNDTTSGYDGLVDITHGSQFVTVSWTLFQNHKDTSLVGHTADVTAQAEDQNLSVTYHHNLFLNVTSGPRVRWGMVHVFSNHFQDDAVGVVSESEATVQVDHNVFDNVMRPILTTYQDATSGYMIETGNKFTPSFTPDIAPPTTAFNLPYGYSSDAADSVSAIVSQCAGTGQLTF
jgi:pectate lyase